MDVHTLFEGFKNQHVVVVGDVMLDAYVEGKVSRISPEAPVPIITLTGREERLGGAANVALNLLSLGASVTICSVIGKDEAGDRMIGIMEDRAISTSGLFQSTARKTTVKTRVIGNNQHVVRVDDEHTNDITTSEESELIQKMEAILENGCDAIIFEDYNKGVLTERVISEIIALAKRKNVITTVDPKMNNFFAYKGVTLFKPNFKELKEGVKRDVSFHDKHDFESAVAELNQALDAQILFVTLSENGVYIQKDTEKHYISAHLRTIADVSGAGDTVISVATLCLCIGLDIKMTASIANLAGGLVCEKVGVVAIDKELLKIETAKL